MTSPTRRQVLYVGCSVFVFVVIALLARPFFADAYERLSFSLAPSASKAMEYGENHFDASDARSYDLPLAQFFFLQAARLDPNTPYVYHELARIDFLQGDFSQALALIDLQIVKHGDTEPNSYYVRGLIEGYMGEYSAAATDYEHFLKFDPHNWAGLNDYAWVLMKDGRYKDAFLATSKGLQAFPDNPWLLNSNAIALYEMGYIKEAQQQAQLGAEESKNVTVADWLHAYPGNDPKIAAEGVAAFKSAALENMHMVLSTTSKPALQ